jgi:hypothetical protein
VSVLMRNVIFNAIAMGVFLLRDVLRCFGTFAVFSASTLIFLKET